MQRAFVAGATGFVGREVVRQLTAVGAPVTAHIRPGSRAASKWAPQFRDWGGDVTECQWDVDSMASAIGESAIVYCCIGTTASRAKSDGVEGDRFREVDLRLTTMLMDAAVAAGKVRRFVYLSSVGASESSRSAYLSARGEAEAYVIASGIPFSIARPSFITGPDRDDSRPLERIGAGIADAALVGAGFVGLSKLRDRYRSIDNIGLATALIELAAEEEGTSRVVDGAVLQSVR